jgi:hypothetical protein
MLALLLLAATPALAHQGPPYPIIVDRAVGPYTFTVWADPDVGTATFYMTVEGAAPDVIELWVQPDDRHLPEVRTLAKPQSARDPGRYIVEAEFDTQEWWRTRFVLRGAPGVGEVAERVQVTPPGLGPFDLLLYLSPFIAVGFLWMRAVLHRRGARRAR